MSYPVIKAENVSKKYSIGKLKREDSFQEILSGFIKSPASILSRQSSNEDFWALKDVSFEVNEGDVVGIIGRNGSGKSTLLKILSRITEPTEGKITLKGRVASLLEVGTGFNAELTGRENIFLNGSILGMTRAEIRKHFDEIVDFSGVEKFLDTPVKRYSSGMYIRLAFAVAAHLESEILLVDEVLAVGDAEFQKKCLGKMGSLAKSGRTVLFVSHSLKAIRDICPRSILLNKGEMELFDNTSNTLIRYEQIIKNYKIDEFTAINDTTYRRGSGTIRITNLEITNSIGKVKKSYFNSEKIMFVIDYKTYIDIEGLTVCIGLKSADSREIVMMINNRPSEKTIPKESNGRLIIEIDPIQILPGLYPIFISISDKYNSIKNYDVLDNVSLPLVIKWESDIIRQGDGKLTPTRGAFTVPYSIKTN